MVYDSLNSLRRDVGMRPESVSRLQQQSCESRSWNIIVSTVKAALLLLNVLLVLRCRVLVDVQLRGVTLSVLNQQRAEQLSEVQINALGTKVK